MHCVATCLQSNSMGTHSNRWTVFQCAGSNVQASNTFADAYDDYHDYDGAFWRWVLIRLICSPSSVTVEDCRVYAVGI